MTGCTDSPNYDPVYALSATEDIVAWEKGNNWSGTCLQNESQQGYGDSNIFFDFVGIECD